MLEGIFEDILKRRDAYIVREKGGTYTKNNPTAGDISSCARETALAILHSEARPAFDTSLLHRFEVGDTCERLGLARLQQLGFEIIEQQKWCDFKDERGRRIWRGKLDAKLRHPSYHKPIVLEWKSIDPNIFPRIHTYQDLLDHRFFRKYIKQTNLYMFHEGCEVGIIFLDNMKGQWRPIEVPFLEDLTDQILRQCHAAVDAIEKIQAGHLEDDVLPTFHADVKECEKCWCRNRVCFPPMVREGYHVLEDEVLAALLDRREELEELGKEFKTVDAQVKEMVKGREGLVVGNWLVEGKEGKRHIKAKEAYTQTVWKSKFVRLQDMAKAA